MPYSASALGVLPPLWSRAAKKPRPVLTFSNWVVFTVPYSGTSRTGLAPGCLFAHPVPAAVHGATASGHRAPLAPSGAGGVEDQQRASGPGAPPQPAGFGFRQQAHGTPGDGGHRGRRGVRGGAGDL